jgi:methyl-accepting chemotaxis protein
MLNKFKLSTRILMLGVVIVVAFSAVFGWLYPRIKGNMHDAKYLKTRHLVEAAYSVVAHYASLSEKGAMTQETAQL